MLLVSFCLCTNISRIGWQMATEIRQEAEQSYTGVIEAMDLSGDSKIYWDRGKMGEVAAAEKSFDTLKEKGYVAFRLNSDGSTGEQIREFDPNAERIVMRPPLAGG